MRRLLLFVAVAASSGACRSAGQEAPAAAGERPTQARPDRPPEPAPEPELAPAPEPAFEQAGALHYLEVTVGGASTDDRLPMIVAIHGLGDDPRNFADLVADFDQPARLILPRAIDEYEGGGWSWFPGRARDEDVEMLARGISEAADVIAAGVEQIRESRPTRGKPIVTGFSQGGMLTFALAVRHPEDFSAAIAVGGWLPPPLWPSEVADPKSYPPITALHGDADPAVKLEPTRAGVAKLEQLGLDAELHVYPGVRHAIPPAMRAQLHQLLRTAYSALPED